MDSGEAYICLVDDAPDTARADRLASPQSHSFTPLVSTLVGDRWRMVSEGIHTHVSLAGENPPGDAGFKIRLSVLPAIADDVLNRAVPIIVGAECPFKMISNTALLELACSRYSSGEEAGDFMTIYPPSRELFNDLTAKLQRATQGISSSGTLASPDDSSGRTKLAPDNALPGLNHFLPNECAYFFGHEDEQLELVLQLERGVITVVLGRPGVGKSSLLRAGLKPLFERMRFEQVYMRLQCAGAISPVQQVRDEINRVLTVRHIDGAPIGEGQTLWEYFHLQESGWIGADRKAVVPVLIFDQFENVLTSDCADPAVREQVEALWTQLADLVENRVPETVSQPTPPSSGSGTERNGFKVVISLRQDHLPELLTRRGQMPSITQNHFLLKPFTGWQPQTTDQRERREPEETKLPAPGPEHPVIVPLPAPAVEHARRPKYLGLGLAMLLIIIIASVAVIYHEKLQRERTEAELEESVRNLAAARNTFESANKKLALAESDLALKESKLLTLSERTRAQELETQDLKKQNSRLAGEQTNLQSRIAQLIREKAQAESRMAQWSNVLYGATNPIVIRKNTLLARNDLPASTTGAGGSNSSGIRPARSKISDEDREAAMESFPAKLPSAVKPDAALSSPRNVNVLLTHGQCLYAEDGTNFQSLDIHHVLSEGATIRTGKRSWSDIFLRRAGTTVRVAPESQLKIAKLSQASQNGVPVTDTLLELDNGRIFTVVRALVPGNILEISDAAGHSVMEGGGLGCYMITAPGPDTADKLSITPLRVITQNGSTVIAAGEEYSAREGAAISLDPTRWEVMLIQLDELEAETDKAIAKPEPPESPVKN